MTMKTPAKLLLRDFQRLVSGFTGDVDDVAEFRDCSARAGGLLCELIRADKIHAPDPPAPWLGFALNESPQLKFLGVEHGHDENSEFWLELLHDGNFCEPTSSFGVEDLMERIRTQQSRYETAQGVDSLNSARAHRDRHVWHEAVAKWMPERFPSVLPETFELEPWIALMTNGEFVYLISDLALTNATQFVRASERAWRFLCEHSDIESDDSPAKIKKPEPADELAPIKIERLSEKKIEISRRGLRSVFVTGPSQILLLRLVMQSPRRDCSWNDLLKQYHDHGRGITTIETLEKCVRRLRRNLGEYAFYLERGSFGVSWHSNCPVDLTGFPDPQ